MDDQRRQEAEKVNKVVASYLRGYKSLFPEFVQGDEIMWNLLEQRTITPGIRSYIAYKLFTLSGGQDWQRIIGPLLGVIEVSIISSYATNRVFDKKSGGRTDTEAMKSIMTSALALNGIYHTLYAYYKPEFIERLHLWYEISDIQRWFYLGQYINSFRNVLPSSIQEEIRVENLPAGFGYVLQQIEKVEVLMHGKLTGLSDSEIHAFLRNQFLRLYLINAHFHERFAALSVRMHRDITAKQESLLNGFGALYGVGTQIINDVIDFALPSMGLECTAKTTEDFFSDLTNMVATFPIFFGFYMKGDVIGKKMFSDHYYDRKIELSESQKERILCYLLESKSIQTSLRIASLCLEEARRCLNDSLVLRPDSALMDIFKIYRESRFVVSIFKWYRRQKRTRKEVDKACQTA
jgi:hypothetical protein